MKFIQVLEFLKKTSGAEQTKVLEIDLKSLNSTEITELQLQYRGSGSFHRRKSLKIGKFC